MNKTKILIVEDSKTQAAHLKYLLEMNNYAVRWATEGSKALEMLNQSLPNLIISDILMPGIDGFELCQKIKSTPEYKSIPFILLTSLSKASDIIKGLECGTDSFITKPFNEDFLLTKIQYLLLNFKMRQNQSMEMGLKVLFAGKRHLITSSRLQILDLLLSTYENAVFQNAKLNIANNELERIQLELKKANNELENTVKERTSELQKNQHLLITLTSEAPIVMFMIDQDGVFNFSDGKGLNKLGYSPGQVVGSSIYEIYKDFDEIIQPVKRALMGEEIRELININNIVFDTLFQPVFDNLGKVISVVGVSIDVTQQKEIEEKLKIKSEQLEKSNLEKEKIIANKDKLLNIISHDLLGSFNPLMGFSNMLANESEQLSKREISKIAGTINGILDKQFQLLNNLLEWGRIENNRLEFNPVHLNLAECVMAASDLLEQNMNCKKIEFESAIDPNLEVFADKHMLNTIFRNLISNAIKFSFENGKIMITANILKNEVQINIIDNGVGIDIDHTTKLFHNGQFYSTEGTNKEKGSGLGLILCKEFLDKHGGKIWISNTQNKGTTICFTLPTH